MLDRQWAEGFAADWIAVWNRRDLDAILAHYADDVVFHSPRIALVMGEAVDLVAGKPALARYWGKALAESSDLHFTFDRLYVGATASRSPITITAGSTSRRRSCSMPPGSSRRVSARTRNQRAQRKPMKRIGTDRGGAAKNASSPRRRLAR
jgi:hypothetical protein